MQGPRFTENNEPFTCLFCGEDVSLHPSSSRDHCTRCLTGLHVDVFPGDRLNECGGRLRPIGIQTRHGERRIVYRCETCHAQVFAPVAPDDNEELIAGLFRMSW
jgi:DNA-directed RNA polymerase subunit RPC12/RpoP